MSKHIKISIIIILSVLILVEIFTVGYFINKRIYIGISGNVIVNDSL